MKVFISIPWFHPAYKAGGPIQSIAGMIMQMAMPATPFSRSDRGNNPIAFKIFCGNKDVDGSLLHVPLNEWVKHSENCMVWYSANDDILPVLKKEIAKEPAALLYLVGLYDWQYNIKPLLFIKGIQKIVSVRGMLHPGALTQKVFKKKAFLFLLKMFGWQRKYIFHAGDEAEKEFVLKQLGAGTKVMVAGNFPNLLKPGPMQEKAVGKLKLISVGLVSPMKNYLMVLEALKKVSGESSGLSGEIFRFTKDDSLRNGDCVIEYNIYGAVKDKSYWQQCRELIERMPPGIEVNYHGAVEPAFIEKALAENHVFILPSKSENFGHSIVEALSAGRPVITSNNTPWNNLETAKAGMNVSLTDTAALVDAIAFFKGMDQEELLTWSKEAEKYAQGAVDVDRIRGQYEEMFG